ncbi:MAG: hypothetical protein IJI14_18745 [Anaerolineaceae bacterium]|nr:hypothetical protein [Anaerolineaceae bacterium]
MDHLGAAGLRGKVHEAPDTSVPRLVRILSGACAPGDWDDDATVNHNTWCGCT